MENNIEILKLFTRKLANCKYLVPADKLTQYLNDGSFGYSFNESGDNIVTNDSVFADEVAQVVEHIRLIFHEPHIILKQEETVRNVSTATEFDVRAFNETIKDEKLWRVKLGEIKPEFVHTYVREENLAIYENRFICYLLDFLCDSVTKKLNTLCESLSTFNRKIDEKDNVIAYPQQEYIGYTENVEEIPLLLKKSDPQIVAICSLFKSKTVLNSLKSYEIYKACKQVGFDITSLKPTNILNCDKNYNYCYRFYLSYLLRDNLYLTESQMYSQFALINLMTAITNCGFDVASDSEDVVINNSTELKVDCVNFEKGLFRINLSKEKDDIFVTITELADMSTAKYLFRILTAEHKKNIGKSISEYADKLNKETNDYTQIFILTDEIENSDQVVYVSAGEVKTLTNLEKAIKSITLLVEGVAFINSRYCPVCGTTLIAPDNGDYTCTSCESLYHIFHYENRDLIWIKRLPKKAEKRAKTNDQDEVLHEVIVKKDNDVQPTPVKENIIKEKDIAVTASSEETPSYLTRKVTQKSFTGKMSQATKEQVGYYNELKNYLLSFKRVNSRVSWNYDSFNIGREQAVKIAFRGQTMVAYFALDPAKYVDTKYYPHDLGDKKKFEETPMMVKVKSERGVKFAKELINVVCTGLKPVKNFTPVTYKFTRMSDKKLIENGLAKQVFVKIK